MILCCGEALIDMIPVPQAEGGSAFVPHSGGAIFNTAIGLGRLGVPAAMLSGVSNDLFGQQLASDLRANNVETGLLIRSDRLTTLAIVHLVDGSATYSFYDENSAGRMIAEADLPDVPETVQALYFGGISLVAEPAADTYAALAEREANRRLIMLDPNIRPGFISDEVTYRARLMRMIGLSDIVKVSDEDLDWMTQGGAEALLELGPECVIVTEGEKGAVAHRAGGTVSVSAVKATVADTVGAGDTFNSGFLAGLSRGGYASKDGFRSIPDDALQNALELAAQVAAITVSRSGANPPYAHEVGLD